MMAPTSDDDGAREAVRARVVEAAADLLSTGGRDAVTTRAVAAAAGVQAPTMYRLFGDKEGLLDAVAEYGFETYLAGKAPQRPQRDPVAELRAGWDQHVEFALANPALYAVMLADRRPGEMSPAAARGLEILRSRVRRIAAAGRLRVSEERAVQLVHAGGSGTAFALLALPTDHRDMVVSRLGREAVIAAIVADTPAVAGPGPVAAAAALTATLDDTDAISPTEKALLRDWLDRIAAG